MQEVVSSIFSRISAVQFVFNFESRKMHCLTSEISYTFWLARILKVEVAIDSMLVDNRWCR